MFLSYCLANCQTKDFYHQTPRGLGVFPNSGTWAVAHKEANSLFKQNAASVTAGS